MKTRRTRPTGIVSFAATIAFALTCLPGCGGTAPASSSPGTAADTGSEKVADAAADSGQADAGSSAADMALDTASGATDDASPGGGGVTWLALPAAVVKMAKYKGALEVGCLPLKDGEPAAAPAAKISVTATATGKPAGKSDAGKWTFAESGRYTVTCASGKAAGSTEIWVCSKHIDPALPRLSDHIRGVAHAIVTAVRGMPDKENPDKENKALSAALASLREHALKTRGAFGADTSLFLAPKPLPDADALEKAGMVSGAQDLAWLTAIGEAIGIAKALQSELETADPKTLTKADVVAMQEHNKQLEAAIAKIAGTEPSELQVRKSTDAVDGLARAIAAVASAQGLYVQAAIEHAAGKPPPPFCPTCYNLPELVVTVAIQHVLAAVSYQALLKELGLEAANLYAQMTLKKVLDWAYEPAANGPVLEQLANGAQNSIHQGDTIKIWGRHFDTTAGACDVTFISPKVSSDILKTIQNALALTSLPTGWSDADVWAAAQFVRDGHSYVRTAIAYWEDLHGWGDDWVAFMQTKTVQDIFDDGTKQMITLGKVPQHIVCGKIPGIALLYPTCGLRVGKSTSIGILGMQCP